MEQKSIKCLINVLSKWPTVDVRTVPNVMYQVVCGTDYIDNSIEYRFHWFLDCTETYIHNHRYAFDTYCLEGEYIEKLWEISDSYNDAITYGFSRTAGNKFSSVISIPGVLRSVTSRRHFPGNVLHVNIDQFHSITPIHGSDNQVLTFVARQICSSASKNTYILSSSDVIKAPIYEIRMATPEERLAVFQKLQGYYSIMNLNIESRNA